MFKVKETISAIADIVKSIAEIVSGLGAITQGVADIKENIGKITKGDWNTYKYGGSDYAPTVSCVIFLVFSCIR